MELEKWLEMKITTFKYIGKLMITFIPKEDKTNV